MCACCTDISAAFSMHKGAEKINFTVVQVMRNTSHASGISRSSSPLVSVSKCDVCVRMFNFLNVPSTSKMPLLKNNYFTIQLPGMKTWSLPYSNLLPVRPIRGVRWPPSWPNQSCCPSLKPTAQIHTDLHCVPTAWYETEPCTNLLQLRRVTTMTQYTVI